MRFYVTVYVLCIHRLIQFITGVNCLSLSALPADNINLEQQGVVERCSFEQGLCSWAESEVDTPGTEWTQHKGQEAWPNHGPPRDHTQNSAAGIKLSELLGNEIILKETDKRWTKLSYLPIQYEKLNFLY